jgi:hypothetical protein
MKRSISTLPVFLRVEVMKIIGEFSQNSDTRVVNCWMWSRPPGGFE